MNRLGERKFWPIRPGREVPVTHPISCIVIKSDHLPRKIPALGEVVRVVDRSGFFVVMSIDREHRNVRLIEKGGKHRMLDVPFASLRTLNNSLDRTIRRFLDSAGEPKTNEETRGPRVQS